MRLCIGKLQPRYAADQGWRATPGLDSAKPADTSPSTKQALGRDPMSDRFVCDTPASVMEPLGRLVIQCSKAMRSLNVDAAF